jgi:hypothetical protein
VCVWCFCEQRVGKLESQLQATLDRCSMLGMFFGEPDKYELHHILTRHVIPSLQPPCMFVIQ